jgi:hypothetical protein
MFWQQNARANSMFFAVHVVLATGLLGAALWLLLRARRSVPATS